MWVGKQMALKKSRQYINSMPSKWFLLHSFLEDSSLENSERYGDYVFLLMCDKKEIASLERNNLVWAMEFDYINANWRQNLIFFTLFTFRHLIIFLEDKSTTWSYFSDNTNTNYTLTC